MALNTSFHPLTRLVHGDDYVSFAELSQRSPEAAEHGDADFYVSQVDLVTRYAFTGSAELFLGAPYKVETLRVDEEDEHHRNESFHGPGDLRLGGKHFFLTSDTFLVGATLGLSLPTGRRNRTAMYRTDSRHRRRCRRAARRNKTPR